MKRILLFIIVALVATTSYSQHVHEFDEGLKCSHIKSGISNDFGKYLYDWQDPLMDKYDVTFYFLDLEVTNTSAQVIGDVTIEAIAVQQVDTFAFELKSFHIISQIFVNGIEYTSWDRYEDNVTVPVATIPQDSSISAQIIYDGIPPTGGFFSGISHETSDWGPEVTWTLSEPFAASDWFPVKQDLEDKADSVWVFLTTEETNMAGSQGLLTNIVDLGNGQKRYEWKSNYPIDYYLISFAVSEYQEYNIYAFPTELEDDSILIQNFVYDVPGCLEENQPGIDETPGMIELFSDLYILYPFWEEKYGHCLTELGGGMEHQTMSTMGGFSFGLVSHELGHMWFGDNVTCATWSDIWINEGFATYSNCLAEEFIHGTSSGQSFIKNAQDYAMSSEGGSVYIPIEEIYPGNEWRIFSGRLSYYKGASILHMLRHEINDDDIFWEVMSTFQTNFTDSTATGEDFKNTAEDVTGTQWDDFFDQWYYGEGYPYYDIEYYNDEGYNHFSILQTPSSSTPFFDQHMDLRLYFDDGSDTLISYHQDESFVEFNVFTGRELMYINVDPDEWNMEKVSSISVNIKENDTPAKFRMAQSKESISLYFDNSAHRSISITDISGKIIQQVQTEDRKYTFNTTKLPNGVFMIVSSDGYNRYVEKFVR